MYAGDEFYDDDVTSGLDDEDDCTWCQGEGWESCDDPIQCFARHIWDEHPCTACAGTGLRSKQTVF
jgi:DnaJ-class molecular chaperone